MQKWRRAGIGTPGGWYMLLGCGLLAASLWVPFLTAQRTARIEERADHLAGLLLEACRGFVGELDAAAAEVVMGRFFCLVQRDGVHVGDVEVLDPPLPGTLVSLRNKHYALHLAVSPLESNAVRGPDTESAYEVAAWPLTRVGPGRCAFFCPDDAPRAYTRNLNAAYAGLGSRRPMPGRNHRRPGGNVEASSFYRSFDDERWILY